jgi:hypothetical protein
MKLQLPVLVGLSTVGLIALGFGALPASATDGVVVGATQNGALGGISFLDPATGADITPAIPAGAEFPAEVGSALNNVSGLAFSPVDNQLYALNYYCEVISIDLVTGASATIVASPTGYLGGEPDCEGLAITDSGDILVSMRTTVKKLDVANGSYVDLVTVPSFSNATWLAFEPVSAKIYVGDYTGGNMVVKTISTDGSSPVTLATDPNFVSSVAFDNSGNAVAGYWGGGFFTGLTSDFPAGMTASTADSTDNSYWVAAEFVSTSTPTPTPSSSSTPTNTVLPSNQTDAALAATGTDVSWLLGTALTLGLTGSLAVLYRRRPHCEASSPRRETSH